MRIKLLDNMHPEGAAPLDAALLEEEDQPAPKNAVSLYPFSMEFGTGKMYMDRHVPVGRSSLSLDHLQDVIGSAVSLSLPRLCSQPRQNPQHQKEDQEQHIQEMIWQIRGAQFGAP